MATNPFKAYEVDKEKERNGVEITIDDMVFLCRRAGGTNRAYRAAIGKGSIDPKYREILKGSNQEAQLDVEDQITMQAYADTVVLNWEGVLGRDDQPLPFSPENFMEVMSACPDLWMLLRARAAVSDAYLLKQVQELGEAVGNS